MQGRSRVKDIIDKKKNGIKISMLTAYDHPMASIIDKCGIDIILVGDSLANVVLGLESTKDVDLETMLHHSKAVNRAVKKALLVGDMPYCSYQVDIKNSVNNAKRFVDEAGCDAIKLEWFDNCLEVAENIVKAGIPVMGHVGLTPQTADKLGGFKVQGKDAEAAKKIIDQAMELEKRGCFSIVLECIPDKISEIITKNVNIPTIGIGAGSYCDGQVLVTNDLLGLFEGFHPKFAKRYIDISKVISEGVNDFKKEVMEGKFPDKEHSFSINDAELKKLSSEQE